nr:PREDICTED: U2 snRNP-associated SURP motif-containing protein [Bemisia tabaci]
MKRSAKDRNQDDWRPDVSKKIPEQKLQAFSIGTMGKRALSKREIEEQRKKEQEEAAAQAFQEFVETFQEEPSKTSKVWVKAGTYDAGKRQEDARDRGKLYKPQSRLEKTPMSSAEQAQEYAKFLGDKRNDRQKKKGKDGEKKKSNLELFKEELKMIQEEREERHKYKGALKSTMEDPSKLLPAFLADDVKSGSFDPGDPTTTNLYLGNLNPKITEQQLMEVFGKYGPLASIKIMWPRSDEEKARGRNCGFVAFMNRKDGERALRNLNGKDVMSYEMKLGWGKGVPIPSHPIYIPPKLLELTIPPPPSGLPFNAQPHPRDKHHLPHIRPHDNLSPEETRKLDKILSQAIVKVVIPTERSLLMLIHRMIEFVIREGPMFEAMVMNKEISNPMFRFLFENQSPAHVYYRWKLFSLLQGDQQREWRTEEFRMFKGGSIWRPPPIHPYTQGMPEELIEEEVDSRTKGSLSATQRDRLEDLLRGMVPDKLKIAEVMVFCIEHADAAEEICDCIAESLSNVSTALHKKIARFYLVSDILHNCSVKIQNASFYRRGLESRLLQIFGFLRATHEAIESRLKAEGFRARVMRVLRAWDDWAIYSRDFLIKCQNTFTGSSSTPDDGIGGIPMDDDMKHLEDVDGAPLSDVDEPGEEDLDGIPLDGAALLKSAMKNHLPPSSSRPLDTDIDGLPMEDDEDIDGVPLDNEDAPTKSATFVPSRWETVDPEQAEAEAMTTSKWELMEMGKLQESAAEKPESVPQPKDETSQDSVTQDSQSQDLEDVTPGHDAAIAGDDDFRRAKLREVEVKVMQYQDELEFGDRTLKSGWTIQQQVAHYRRKLLRKAEKGEKLDSKKDKSSEKSVRRSISPDEYVDMVESRKHKRSRSKSRSLSPGHKKSHRSHSGSRSPSRKVHRGRSPQSVRSSKKSSHIHTPSPPRIKRKAASPDSPHRSRSRREYSPLSPSSSYRYKYSRSTYSPSPPPSSSRKHKHKHKH